MRKLLIALVLLVGAAVNAQPPALKIVVIDGEDAVNVIQQRTAVRAVVEVRDQNNLPVGGATVTFAVAGQGGTAASTLTVTTNTAGRAALAGVMPTATGPMQISVTAAFKDLAAALTITQTNVATLTTAAGVTGGASGAAAGGGGSAAGAAAGTAAGGGGLGGGLGAGAIVGIVGGVGAIVGGAIVLGGAKGDSRDDGAGSSGGNGASNVTTAPLRPCTFTVSPADELLVPIAGGSYGFTVTAVTTSGCLPEWTVNTNLASAFVTANPTRGSGSGSFTLTFAPFTPAANFPSRSGVVGVADKLIRFFQPTRF